MESMRIAVNLLGNCVTTFVIAEWEGPLDHDAMKHTLAGENTTVDVARMLGKDDEYVASQVQRPKADQPASRSAPAQKSSYWAMETEVRPHHWRASRIELQENLPPPVLAFPSNTPKLE